MRTAHLVMRSVGPSRPRAGRGLVLGTVLLAGCASAPARSSVRPRRGPRFVVGEDTFAFANEIRARTPIAPTSTRTTALSWPAAFASSTSSRASSRAPAARPRRLPGADRAGRGPPSVGPPPPTRRSRDDPRLPQPVRVLPGPGGHGEGGARLALLDAPELDELAGRVAGGRRPPGARRRRDCRRGPGGRLAQLLVTNWPTPELNHTVVAYAYHVTDARSTSRSTDPNDPASPGLVSFERRRRRFWATRVYDTRPGRIRAFRMYYSPWL